MILTDELYIHTFIIILQYLLLVGFIMYHTSYLTLDQ